MLGEPQCHRYQSTPSTLLFYDTCYCLMLPHCLVEIQFAL